MFMEMSVFYLCGVCVCVCVNACVCSQQERWKTAVASAEIHSGLVHEENRYH